MSDQGKPKPSGESIAGRKSSDIEVNIKLSLPEGQAALEIMLAGEKWKQLVADLQNTMRHWRDTTENPAQADAFTSVCNLLREEMASAGLTLMDPELLEQERWRKRKRQRDDLNQQIGFHVDNSP